MEDRVNKYSISTEGLEELKSELEQRLNSKREDLKEMIEEMRSRGDLSENEGYTLALEEFESNERRIAELTDLIDNAKIIKRTSHNSVGLGNKVTVEVEGKERSYTIVGESEANPIDNKVSAETPLGKALIGKKVGQSFSIELPLGTQALKILNIE